MIGEIASAIFDDPYTDVSKMSGAPDCLADFTGMYCCFDLFPFGNSERDTVHFHKVSGS
jgi:hypothetical protein